MCRRTGWVSIASVVAGLALSLPGAAQVSLVREGKARAVVVTADEPSRTARYAAEELVWHVAHATGVTLKTVVESDTPGDVHTRVFIGDTGAGRARGLDPDRLPREAYTMRSFGNDLFILGREDDGDPLQQNNPNVGTLFGVYEFLERVLGARWLWPGELGTFVPRTDTVEFWALNETEAPALRFRSIRFGRIASVARDPQRLSDGDTRLGFSPDVAVSYGKALEILLRRHRMGGRDVKPRTGHAFSGWWQRYGVEHPEWFALRRDGVRGHPDKDYVHVPMCVSNPELHDFIVEQWDGGDTLLLGPVDRPGRCTCENCQAWDGSQPEDPPWFAKRVYATDHRAQELFAGATPDRYARFWKAIHEKARKRNPDVLVSGSFIYENEFPAPSTDMQLNGNIYGEFVQWQDPHLRYFPMPDEAFEWIKEQWLGWRATGIRMAYRPNYLHDGYVMPHFETRQSGEFFKFAYAHGMEGADFDSLTGQWAAQGLRLYMHFRLMSEPELDLDAIRDEYCAAFGPAADTMQRYFAYWEDYAFEHRMRIIEMYWDVGWRYSNYVRRAHAAFPPECFGPAEALLEQALTEAGESDSPEFGERVEFVRLGLRHARLASRLAAAYKGEEKVPEGQADEVKRAVKELIAFRKENERSYFSDLYHATSFWELNRLLDLGEVLDTTK
ncbi:MAG: DUF4838 domain-containing protein [bacterium]|nr:DUF4838 domain-containing protein [bacterium]